MARPLAGVKVVHLVSLGPGPYCAMLLADMGCDVTIVDRVHPMTVSVAQDKDPRRRGQKSIALNLKSPDALTVLHDLIRGADVFIEGMRPGVAERMGAGPQQCLSLNPRLIYARITGWGQDGPLAQRAGHDINYVALSGALLAMGKPDEPPPVPLNLLGDYAGGGVFVALGIVSALYERQRSGCGQVIDGAIADGVGSLTTAVMGMLATGKWGKRGESLFDGSAPWYRTYATRDGGFIAVGAIEPQFYKLLMEGLGLDPARWDRSDPRVWPEMAEIFSTLFRAQDRDHWERVFAGTDACVSPVLSFAEAISHPHHQARNAYFKLAGVVQPAVAPRLDGSAAQEISAPPAIGQDTDAVLRSLGRTNVNIAMLRDNGAAA